MHASHALVVAGLLIATVVPINAQTGEQEVLAIATRFFDAMRARDTAAMAGTLRRGDACHDGH
jgi:hypothetical protein